MNLRATTIAVLVILAGVVASVPATATHGSAGPTAASASAAAQDPEIPDCSYPLEVTDATGTQVRIEDEPQEIVTLAPSAAQTMWEIGGKDKVVGVSQFASYLDGASQKANISAPGFGQYDVERIVSLDPDLVLAPNVIPKQAVQQIRNAGIKVVKFPKATTIADVKEKTRLMGQLVGECEGAAKAIKWMEENLEVINTRVETRQRPEVLYLLGSSTVGANTYINDMLVTAGGDNIMAAAGITGYQKVDEEIVADTDPEWIVVTNPNNPLLNQTPYNRTTAVTEDQVLVLNPNYVNQPAPRSVVFALKNMTQAFHSEAYGEGYYIPRDSVELDATPTPSPTRTETVTETPTRTPVGDTETPTETATATETATETTESGGQAGFGLVVAAVSLLGAALALRRRD